MNERITCHNCQYCKIWYDKENYCMRLSCTKSSEKSKSITYEIVPYFTEDSECEKAKNSAIEKLKDFSKRRLAPIWCEYRISNTKPPVLDNDIIDKYPCKYHIVYAYTPMFYSNGMKIESVQLSYNRKIKSFDDINFVAKQIKESIINKEKKRSSFFGDTNDINLVIINYIEVGSSDNPIVIDNNCVNLFKTINTLESKIDRIGNYLGFIDTNCRKMCDYLDSKNDNDYDDYTEKDSTIDKTPDTKEF